MSIEILKKELKEYFRERKITKVDEPELLKIKSFFEKTINNFPVEPISTYLEACNLIQTPQISELELLFKQKEALAKKSHDVALNFLTHTAFKIDTSQNVKIVANKKLLSGTFSLQTYQELLEKYTHSNGMTYWDIFKDGIIFATPYYNPLEGSHYFSDSNHCFLNTFIAPSWQSQCLAPIGYEELDPVLKAFLEHLFPDPAVLHHVLKWCAFSRTNNLQTYLTLIGVPGVGKTIFVQDFIAYYHGYENLKIVNKIESLSSKRNHDYTLLYLDEMQMNSLDNYNTIKRFTNDLVGCDPNSKSPAKNFANIIWSSNNKEAMSALAPDDRRFKIIPITDKFLNEKVGAFTPEGDKILEFNIENIQKFKDDVRLKNQLVAHFLHIIESHKGLENPLQDINTVEDNSEKQEIIFESRDKEFKEVFKIICNIKNDFDLKTKRKILPEDYTDEMIFKLGTPFVDFMPVTEVRKPKGNTRYNIRIPYKSIKKVIDLYKINNFADLNYNKFKKNCMALPPKYCRLKHVWGNQDFDLEIYLPDFCPKMKEILDKYQFTFELTGDKDEGFKQWVR